MTTDPTPSPTPPDPSEGISDEERQRKAITAMYSSPPAKAPALADTEVTQLEDQMEWHGTWTPLHRALARIVDDQDRIDAAEATIAELTRERDEMVNTDWEADKHCRFVNARYAAANQRMADLEGALRRIEDANDHEFWSEREQRRDPSKANAHLPDCTVCIALAALSTEEKT